MLLNLTKHPLYRESVLNALPPSTVAYAENDADGTHDTSSDGALYGVGASLEAGKGVAVFKLGLGADFHHRSGSEWRDDSFDAVAHRSAVERPHNETGTTCNGGEHGIIAHQR